MMGSNVVLPKVGQATIERRWAPKTLEILKKLSKSKFRSNFKLDIGDIEYIRKKGIAKIESHARDFITEKLAPRAPRNDGRQTPFKGHPVFKAQHATAACCRGCLKKWHKIPLGRKLRPDEIEAIVALIMRWISTQRGDNTDENMGYPSEKIMKYT